MESYEQAAFGSLQTMGNMHTFDMDQLRKEILSKYHPFAVSKQCCEYRDMEKRHFAVKEYLKANDYRNKSDELEMIEI